jgi:tRNA threonylcarbamoyladenosine biosynthesis protein TsaB
MKILAIDTSTMSCSTAIIDRGAVRAELTTINKQTHSKHLMTMIDTVCTMSGIKMAEMDGFAVTIGPGSFTGLRIGISTIKGLAWSLAKPVVGISSLAALAWQCAPVPYLICPLLDARKHEVYAGRYRYSAGKLIKDGDELVSAPLAVIDDIREPCVFLGSGAALYRKEISNKLGELSIFAERRKDHIRASAIAELSVQRFVNHRADEAASLVPHYIRKSDAELTWQNKRNPTG